MFCQLSIGQHLWAIHVPGRKQKRTQRRKFLFVLDKACDEQTRPQYYETLKDRFVSHALAPERTKTLVFVYVFVSVLAHELLAISSNKPATRGSPLDFWSYIRKNLKKIFQTLLHTIFHW